MHPKTIAKLTILKQVGYFFIHLRWHYQIFILSGGFLLGGFFSSMMNGTAFTLQFLNVHLLLFGGATAYNSYWDKDKGPVGGLKNPPPMTNWMHPASLLMQWIGVFWALRAGMFFCVIYLISMLLFWLYSTPLFRWKGSPLKSLIVIGISTGVNSLLLGYLAAGNEIIHWDIWLASIGVGCVILSFYPLSQLYQVEEDQRRGDVTYAIKYGFKGVKRFFQGTFTVGILLLAVPFVLLQWWLGTVWILLGVIIGCWVSYQLKILEKAEDGYTKIMRIKYAASLAFVSFIGFLLLNKHVI